MPQPAHLPWGIWWPRWATHSLTFTPPVQGWITHRSSGNPCRPLRLTSEVTLLSGREEQGSAPRIFCIGNFGGYEALLGHVLGDCLMIQKVDALWEKIGYDFDPNWFDLKDVNQRLQKFR